MSSGYQEAMISPRSNVSDNGRMWRQSDPGSGERDAIDEDVVADQGGCLPSNPVGTT